MTQIKELSKFRLFVEAPEINKFLEFKKNAKNKGITKEVD